MNNRWIRPVFVGLLVTFAVFLSLRNCRQKPPGHREGVVIVHDMHCKNCEYRYQVDMTFIRGAQLDTDYRFGPSGEAIYICPKCGTFKVEHLPKAMHDPS